MFTWTKNVVNSPYQDRKFSAYHQKWVKSRPAYPKILLSVLHTACWRIFRFFTRFFFCCCFCQCTINQSKQTKNVKGQFFYHSYCKNSVRTRTVSDTDALQNKHIMTLGWFILFTSAKVVLDYSPYFEKYACTSILLSSFRTNTVKYGQ